jgi:hypothetical protein
MNTRLSNKKTAELLLRFTGRFHARWYSPPVNLRKPKIKVVAAVKHEKNCWKNRMYADLSLL